mgnify:CR=1 FL=1
MSRFPPSWSCKPLLATLVYWEWIIPFQQHSPQFIMPDPVLIAKISPCLSWLWFEPQRHVFFLALLVHRRCGRILGNHCNRPWDTCHSSFDWLDFWRCVILDNSLSCCLPTSSWSFLNSLFAHPQAILGRVVVSTGHTQPWVSISLSMILHFLILQLLCFPSAFSSV